MAVDGVQVQGLDQLKAKFAEIPRQLRNRYLRNWLAAGGRIVQREAKAKTPVLSATSAKKAPYRKPGTVRDAIKVRTSKLSKKKGDVGVFVNVKPAKSGQRGAKNPNDPFYWSFQNFGWNPARKGERKKTRRALVKAGAAKRIPGKRFLEKAAEKLPEALKAFENAASKWFQKINSSGSVK